MSSPPSTGLPFGRPLTSDDLVPMPDDGHRYELLDGVLIGAPAPSGYHQLAAGALYRLLSAAPRPTVFGHGVRLPGGDLILGGGHRHRGAVVGG